MSRHFLGPDPLARAANVPHPARTRATDAHRRGQSISRPRSAGAGSTPTARCRASGRTTFAILSELGPVEGATVADWPLGYDELEPYYAEAERAIGVAGDAGANPFAAWRSGPYPMPPGAPMYGAV